MDIETFYSKLIEHGFRYQKRKDKIEGYGGFEFRNLKDYPELSTLLSETETELKRQSNGSALELRLELEINKNGTAHYKLYSIQKNGHHTEPLEKTATFESIIETVYHYKYKARIPKYFKPL